MLFLIFNTKRPKRLINVSICDIYVYIFFIRFYDDFFFHKICIYIFSIVTALDLHFYCVRQTVVHINFLLPHIDPFIFLIWRDDGIKRLDSHVN